MAARKLLGFEEVGNVRACRLPHEIFGCVHLLETTLPHDGDAVRQGDTIRYVVSHIDGRQAILLVERHDFPAHPKAVRGIDVTQRLIHEQDSRRSSHSSAQSDSLLLAAGKFRRSPLKKTLLNTQFLCQRPQKFADFFTGPLPNLQRQGKIGVTLFVENLHMRPEGVALKNHLNSPLAHGNVVDGNTADENRAAVRSFQAGDESQGCGLAAPALADDDQKFTAVDREVGAVDRDYGTKPFREIT